MEEQEIEQRQDNTVTLRGQLDSAKKLLRAAESNYKIYKKTLIGIKKELDAALQRERELESGKGKLLESMQDLKVYEFWLEIPGYSGGIQGAAAQLIQHGSLQQVSDVTNNRKSGLAGGIIGGLLLGPVGAAAGVLATRKNEVSTQIREVDTRQLEFVVQGPGYAWSTTADFGFYNDLRRIRDLINSLGSKVLNIDDIRQSNFYSIQDIKGRAVAARKDFMLAQDVLSQRRISYEELLADLNELDVSPLSGLKLNLIRVIGGVKSLFVFAVRLVVILFCIAFVAALVLLFLSK